VEGGTGLIAYKFLRAGGLGHFSGFAWPLAGEWVSGRVSACRASDLPIWLSEELWVAELVGPVVEARSKLVAPRGRLLRQVHEWSEVTAGELALACARRTRGHAATVLRASGMSSTAELLQGFTLEELPEAEQLVPHTSTWVCTAVGYAADAANAAMTGAAAAAAYVATCAAQHAADSPGAAARERAWQARWMRDRLSLARVA
jgi:hypothetical protein